MICVLLPFCLLAVASAITLRVDSPSSHAGIKMFASNSIFTDTSSLANGGSQAELVFFEDDPAFCNVHPELTGQKVAVIARRDGNCPLSGRAEAMISSRPSLGSFVIMHDHSSLKEAMTYATPLLTERPLAVLLHFGMCSVAEGWLPVVLTRTRRSSVGLNSSHCCAFHPTMVIH